MDKLNPVKASEYKAKHVKTKLIKTSNGDVFKIRPISPIDYINGRIPANTGKEDIEKGKEFIKAIITTCVLEPRIVEKNPKDNELSLEDLTFDDYLLLSKEITNFSTSGNVNFLAKGQNS